MRDVRGYMETELRLEQDQELQMQINAESRSCLFNQTPQAPTSNVNNIVQPLSAGEASLLLCRK